MPGQLRADRSRAVSFSELRGSLRGTLLGVLLALLSATLVVGETTWRVSSSATPCLTLRAGPEASGRRLDCLAPGRLASEVSLGAGWVEVRLEDGRTGWLAERFVERVIQVSADSVREPSPEERESFVALEPWPEPREELSVFRGEFRRRVLVTGELRAARATPVQIPQTPAWSVAVRWLIDDGARVREGDRLAELDNSALVSKLEDMRLAVIESQSALVQARLESQATDAEKQLETERARIELEKAKLAAAVPESILSAREYQDRQAALKRAEVRFEKAREDLRAHRQTGRADLEIRRIAVEKARRKVIAIERGITELILVAPSDGIALVEKHYWQDRKFRVGDTMWPGAALLTLPDLSSMEIEALLTDVDDGEIEPGMPGLCRLDAYPDTTYRCRVAEITPVAQATAEDSLRRAFGVRLELELADPERMRPGMSVAVEIESERLEEALQIPRSALGFGEGAPDGAEGRSEMRAALDDGSRREVTIGECNGHECVLLDGLEEGQRLSPWEVSLE